jgi:hypothetical protein
VRTTSDFKFAAKCILALAELRIEVLLVLIHILKELLAQLLGSSSLLHLVLLRDFVES